MALNKTDLSFKKLINKEFTHVSRSFFQEVTAPTLDINSTEVYTNVIANTTGSAIVAGYARQLTQFVLTPDPTYATQAWYVCSGSAFTPGVTSYDSTKVQRNFISDKYGSEFEIKLYDNGGSQIFKTDAINWYFDYKTGILHVADPGAYSTPYKATVIQYIGTTLSSSLSTLSGSISTISGSVSTISGSVSNLSSSLSTLSSSLSTLSTNRISSGSTSVTTYPNNSVIISGSTTISGSLFVNTSITASNFSGAFIGNGSLLTGITSASYASNALLPGIPANSIQFNSASVFAGTSSLIWNNNVFKISGSLNVGNSNTLNNTGLFNIVGGESNAVSGSSNIIGGVNNIVSGSWNNTVGSNNTVKGNYNSALGVVSDVNGTANIVEGFNNFVTGSYNHIEGSANKITGSYSHVEGNNNKIFITDSSDQTYSHIEGQYNTGSAYYAHNEGQYTETHGDFSHAEGLGTIASGSYQHVQGTYNIPDTNSLFIIGNGVDGSNRSNLMSGIGSTVTITGSLKVSGSITGSLAGTASYALSTLSSSYAVVALSASYFSGSVSNAVSSSYAISSSYALSASYTPNALNSISSSYISASITNNSNNFLLTATGGGTINGESKLVFDGSILNILSGGTLLVDGNITGNSTLNIASTISGSSLYVNSGLINSDAVSGSIFKTPSYVDLGLVASNIDIGRAGSSVVRIGDDLQVAGDFLSSNGTPSLNLSNGNVIAQNDLQVNGNLSVLGTTIILNTNNLLVEDKFIILSSGSTSNNDGGIIVQNNVSSTGYALYFDSTGDGTSARWSFAENVSGSATSATPSYFVGSVTGSTAVPSTAPTYGYGTTHIVTGNGDIYIYS